MPRDSRVSEHLDTKSIANPTSWKEADSTIIRLKCRPFGRSNNPWITDFIPPCIHNSRDPFNLGEVRGLIHVSGGWRARVTNARSSRRGKEQMRSKALETWMELEARRSDLMDVEIPCSGMREIE